MRTIFNSVIVAFILLSLHSCKSLDEIPSPIIKLSSDVPAGTTADGKAVFRFTATVSTLASDEYKIVAFRCTGGRFATSDSATVQLLRVNEKGEATSDWIVPNKGGDYIISASIGYGVNTFEERVKISLKDTIPDTIPVIPVIRDTILISVAGVDSVRANNETLLRVNLALKNPHVAQLIVSNNVGTLSDGTTVATAAKPLSVQLDQAGHGELFLKIANKVEPYFIRAVLASDATVVKLFSFTPLRAYPDNIILEADSTMVRPNSQTSVTAFLTRTFGQVSLNTRVNFEAYQDSSGIKKTLSVLKNTANNFTNDLGRSSVLFVADTLAIDRKKPVTIRALSLNDSGQTVLKEITLRVKDK